MVAEPVALDVEGNREQVAAAQPVHDLLAIEPRRRRVGSGEVDRLLPFRLRRTVGPFIFADLIGPEVLGPGAAIALREEAEALEAEAPDTVRFTRAIKDAVPYDERRLVVKALWEVVLADGSRAQEEDAIVRMAANFLGVSDRDSAIARQDVSNAS